MRFALPLVAMLLLTCVASIAAEPPMTPQRWREDLQFLSSELPARHKNAFHTITKAQWQSAVDALDVRLPTMKDHEVVGFMRLVAMIGDGHTNLDAPRTFRVLPVALYRFGNDLRVTFALKPHERVLGQRLVRVGDTPVDQAWQRVLELVPKGENEQFLRWRGASLFNFFEVLHGVGLTKELDVVQLTFADDAGAETTVELRPGDAGERISAAKVTPLYRRKQGDLSFTYLAEHGTMYFRFDGYPPFPKMKAFAAELFAECDRQPVKKLVVDLRQNAGGDFLRFRLAMLPEIRRRAGAADPVAVYVITGRRTFSAAMVNAIDLRNIGAVLVGEPTGGRPNGYSENESFVLPNSRLPVGYSTLYYQFGEPEDDAVKPDHPVELTWDDYAAGRDAALEWILSQPSPTPSAVATTAPAAR